MVNCIREVAFTGILLFVIATTCLLFTGTTIQSGACIDSAPPIPSPTTDVQFSMLGSDLAFLMYSSSLGVELWQGNLNSSFSNISTAWTRLSSKGLTTRSGYPVHCVSSTSLTRLCLFFNKEGDVGILELWEMRWNVSTTASKGIVDVAWTLRNQTRGMTNGVPYAAAVHWDAIYQYGEPGIAFISESGAFAATPQANYTWTRLADAPPFTSSYSGQVHFSSDFPAMSHWRPVLLEDSSWARQLTTVNGWTGVSCSLNYAAIGGWTCSTPTNETHICRMEGTSPSYPHWQLYCRWGSDSCNPHNCTAAFDDSGASSTVLQHERRAPEDGDYIWALHTGLSRGSLLATGSEAVMIKPNRDSKGRLFGCPIPGATTAPSAAAIVLWIPCLLVSICVVVGGILYWMRDKPYAAALVARLQPVYRLWDSIHTPAFLRLPPTFALFGWVAGYVMALACIGFTLFYPIFNWGAPTHSAYGWAFRLPLQFWLVMGEPSDLSTFLSTNATYLVLAIVGLVWLPYFIMQEHCATWGIEQSQAAGEGKKGAATKVFNPSPLDEQLILKYAHRHRFIQSLIFMIPLFAVAVGSIAGQFLAWLLDLMKGAVPQVILALFKSAVSLVFGFAIKLATGWVAGKLLVKGSLLHTRFVMMAYVSTVSVSLVNLQMPMGALDVTSNLDQNILNAFVQVGWTLLLSEGINWLSEVCAVLYPRFESPSNLPRKAARFVIGLLRRDDPTPVEDWKPLLYLCSVQVHFLLNAPGIGLLLVVFAPLLLLSFTLRGHVFARAHAEPVGPEAKNGSVWMGAMASCALPSTYLGVTVTIYQANAGLWELYNPSPVLSLYVTLFNMFFMEALIMIGFYMFFLCDWHVTNQIEQAFGKSSCYIQYVCRCNYWGRIQPRGTDSDAAAGALSSLGYSAPGSKAPSKPSLLSPFNPIAMGGASGAVTTLLTPAPLGGDPTTQV